MDLPDWSGHRSTSDWCPAAGRRQIVLATDRNGGMLWLTATHQMMMMVLLGRTVVSLLSIANIHTWIVAEHIVRITVFLENVLRFTLSENWAVLMSRDGIDGSRAVAGLCWCHVTVLTVAGLQRGCGRQTVTRCERVKTCLLCWLDWLFYRVFCLLINYLHC